MQMNFYSHCSHPSWCRKALYFVQTTASVAFTKHKHKQKFDKQEHNINYKNKRKKKKSGQIFYCD